ncbi:MAG: polyribonucleotide nucleotidyltransferase [Candidatus Yanofskybacteria bacterium]|nr:polyribonucleotide nucleotidyltransferase [Candidatus Yanofskybacteria bacterium]
MKNQKIDIQIGGKTATVFLDSWATQASGSVRVQIGETVVLVTAVMGKEDAQGQGFFPLTVDYEERFYAAGKILGSRFVRRESRPTEEAVITARLIDRAIRPLFPKHLMRPVQVIVTCLSWDGENDPDVAGLLGASFALCLSDIPWNGPLFGVRVGKTGNSFTLNPTYSEREASELDFVIAGMENEGKILLNMIEAESSEAAEESYKQALQFALPTLSELIALQKNAQKEFGKEKTSVPEPAQDEQLNKEMSSFLEPRLQEALFSGDPATRMERAGALKKDVLAFAQEKRPGEGREGYALAFLEEEIDRAVHEGALKYDKRVDGRGLDEIRPLSAQVGVLPRTHGSGMFSRGLTTTLSLLTLGGPGDHKLMEGMEISGKKRFMHHYNFPPYAPGEVKPLRGPGRREIGHGMLAEKALLPVIPVTDEFPYTIRIVTECVSSNGSTSMASACSSSLALMDAGVPIKRPVAGISVGLMADEAGNYKLLTDIQGPEDHYGDMDFKVAGSKEGITAIQLDVKIRGITADMFSEVLERAKKARFQILEEVIAPVLLAPRSGLSKYAPKISVIRINPEKIGMIIGSGGKIINKMTADFNVKIDIDDETGDVFVTSEDADGVRKALEKIEGIVHEVEVGELFQGTVKSVVDFGAFVEILPGQEGLVHISQLAPWRVEKVADIVKVGDVIPVKVIGIDEHGKIRLSRKEALPEEK